MNWKDIGSLLYPNENIITKDDFYKNHLYMDIYSSIDNLRNDTSINRVVYPNSINTINNCIKIKNTFGQIKFITQSISLSQIIIVNIKDEIYIYQRGNIVKFDNNFGKIKQIISSHVHTVFINDIGELYVFGYNQFGQLGLSNIEYTSPTLVKGNWNKIIYISCSIEHTAFLTVDNKVYVASNLEYTNTGNSNKFEYIDINNNNTTINKIISGDGIIVILYNNQTIKCIKDKLSEHYIISYLLNHETFTYYNDLYIQNNSPLIFIDSHVLQLDTSGILYILKKYSLHDGPLKFMGTYNKSYIIETDNTLYVIDHSNNKTR